MADTLPTPITNQEHFLNGIAGNEDVTNIPAITNEEKFLKYIALNGGGGGTSPFYPAGNIAFASLPNPSADILGAMYNITDAFTTDSRFNEGSGVKYPAGTNVAVVNTGTEQSPVYKFDTYAGAYIVDDAFSATSENPVQNKVVKSALDAKADTSAVNFALALKVDKVEGKGLSTNDYTTADKSTVDNSPIASTTTGINPTITDSADGYMQGLTVYGRSDVTETGIHGIGEDGELEITTANSDSSESSTATVTISIPLYSAGDVKDEWNEKRGVIVKRYEKKNLNDFEWTLISNNRWKTPLINAKSVTNLEIINAISNNYTAVSAQALYEYEQLIGMALTSNNDLAIRNGSDTDTPTGDIVYELAEPVEIPLTSAELSAICNLRTYNSATNVTVTDNPTVDVGYLLNTDNGQAVSAVQQELQEQIIAIPAFIAAIPEMHRNIFRGKNLGTAVTAAQLAAIANGSFDDLFVGDYWTSSETINGETVTVKWRIADMDYFYQKGKWADQNVMVHHIIVLPDVALRNAVYGTDFTADNAMVDAVFQNHRLTAYFSNDTSTWTGFTTHHLNSYMLFGYDRTDAQSPYKYPVMDQLSLFRIAPEFMTPYYEENSNLFASQWIMRSNNSQNVYPRMTVRGAIFLEYSSAVGGFRPWFVIGTDNANNS